MLWIEIRKRMRALSLNVVGRKQNQEIPGHLRTIKACLPWNRQEKSERIREEKREWRGEEVNWEENKEWRREEENRDEEKEWRREEEHWEKQHGEEEAEKKRKDQEEEGEQEKKKRENRPYRRIAATTTSVVVAWPCSSVDCKIKRENEV